MRRFPAVPPCGDQALTKEEKAKQFTLLQQRMAQKKAEKAAETVSEAREKEKVRRIEGQKKGNTREENVRSFFPSSSSSLFWGGGLN